MCDDDYIKLIFILLGNQYNQEDTAPNHSDYSRVLLELDLKLGDRLNFATKLLT